MFCMKQQKVYIFGHLRQSEAICLDKNIYFLLLT